MQMVKPSVILIVCSGIYNGPNNVSNTGSNDNGDGSEENPFNTIQRNGLDRMQHNDGFDHLC